MTWGKHVQTLPATSITVFQRIVQTHHVETQLIASLQQHQKTTCPYIHHVETGRAPSLQQHRQMPKDY